MTRPKLDRTNEENFNTFGSLMRIINYRGAYDYKVDYYD